MNSDVIRIRTEKVMEMASAKSSSSSSGSGRISVTRMAVIPDGECDVAAPEHGADVGEARERRRSVAALGRSYVGHAG